MENLNKFNFILILTLLLLGCDNNYKKYEKFFIQYPNYDYYVVVDFSIPSGKNRFFMYNSEKELVLKSLCAHGSGLRSTEDFPVFSNIIGSNCSSLGYFEVKGYNEMSSGDPSYILKGLDASNNNAEKRQILIHPYYKIPELEIFPQNIPLGYSKGCFVISYIKFKIFQYYIKGKRVLLYSNFNKY